MTGQSPSNSGIPLSSAERKLAWTLLDKRPTQSEIISYDPDEIAEIRRLTESELRLISRHSGSGSALNKETQAFLDAASVMRALSHVADHRFEQGVLDGAAQTLINAIRWQRLADGLYLSGGVTLPRINSIRLWYLLAEIYVRMDERDLALKTMQKTATSVGEFGNPSLPELLLENQELDERIDEPPPLSRSYRTIVASRGKRVGLIAGVIILGLLIFTGIRAQVSAKSMIDNSSVGVDYLNIAFGQAGQGQQDETLVLAGREFAILQGKLDSWSWIITLSSVFPPAHDQFVAMDRLSELGTRMTVVPFGRNGSGRLADLGSVESLCASATSLKNFDGNLLDQLEKNRLEMLAHVSAATNGACQPV